MASLFDLSARENMLWHDTGHSFSRVDVHHHMIRVWQHILACGYMCATLAATHTIDSGTDSRRTDKGS